MMEERMELQDRKMKILQAIIRNYLETGEPVGSRTISKYTDLKLSSATIRNEMADLEEMGLIMQPHTSAGRIPSDKGYRFYVDQIIREKKNEGNEGQDLYDAVQKAVDAARAEGADYVIALSHVGYDESGELFDIADIVEIYAVKARIILKN